MAPENLTDTDIHEHRRFIEDNGLTVSAVCGDGVPGFVNTALALGKSIFWVMRSSMSVSAGLRMLSKWSDFLQLQ